MIFLNWLWQINVICATKTHSILPMKYILLEIWRFEFESKRGLLLILFTCLKFNECQLGIKWKQTKVS